MDGRLDPQAIGDQPRRLVRHHLARGRHQALAAAQRQRSLQAVDPALCWGGIDRAAR
jgi:hypothetical protein